LSNDPSSAGYPDAWQAAGTLCGLAPLPPGAAIEAKYAEFNNQISALAKMYGFPPRSYGLQGIAKNKFREDNIHLVTIAKDILQMIIENPNALQVQRIDIIRRNVGSIGREDPTPFLEKVWETCS